MRAPVCPHCTRPLACQRDYLRRRNKLKTSDVCWAQTTATEAWLSPEEEIADAASLRRALACARRLVHVLLCDAMAPVGKRRDWRTTCP